jgi:hypothetical protein
MQAARSSARSAGTSTRTTSVDAVRNVVLFAGLRAGLGRHRASHALRCAAVWHAATRSACSSACGRARAVLSPRAPASVLDCDHQRRSGALLGAVTLRAGRARRRARAAAGHAARRPCSCSSRWPYLGRLRARGVLAARARSTRCRARGAARPDALAAATRLPRVHRPRQRRRGGTCRSSARRRVSPPRLVERRCARAARRSREPRGPPALWAGRRGARATGGDLAPRVLARARRGASVRRRRRAWCTRGARARRPERPPRRRRAARRSRVRRARSRVGCGRRARPRRAHARAPAARGRRMGAALRAVRQRHAARRRRRGVDFFLLFFAVGAWLAARAASAAAAAAALARPPAAWPAPRLASSRSSACPVATVDVTDVLVQWAGVLVGLGRSSASARAPARPRTWRARRPRAQSALGYVSGGSRRRASRPCARAGVDGARRVVVIERVELPAHARPEVVALPLGARAVDDADGRSSSGASSASRAASAAALPRSGTSSARPARPRHLVQRALDAPRERRVHAHALGRLAPVVRRRHRAGVRREAHEQAVVGCRSRASCRG